MVKIDKAHAVRSVFNANTVDDLAKAKCNGFALTARAEWSNECKPKRRERSQFSADPPNEKGERDVRQELDPR
jgi:hypothetical protein